MTESHEKCPEEIDSRCGCKVSWLTYATREDAEIASRFAARQAHRKAELGYDFGYLVPGTITEHPDGTCTVVWP